MAEVVEVDAGGRERRRWALPPGQVRHVGKHGGGADIGLDHDGLPTVGCSLMLEGPGPCGMIVTVKDFAAGVPTFADGVQLQAGGSWIFAPGADHYVGCGDCSMMLKIVISSSGTSGTDGAALSPACSSNATSSVSGRAERTPTSSAIPAANSRSGIAFDYGGAGRGGGPFADRRGEQRQQRKEEERRNAREKRKAVWNTGPPATANAAVPKLPTGGDDSSDEDVSAPGVAGPLGTDKSAQDGGSYNGWEHTSFATTQDKTKFMKLMGCKDGGGPEKKEQQQPKGVASAPQAIRGGLGHDLERQFQQGMRQQLRGRTRGLGC
eukprot:TRINITY_DN15072_c0_g1_i1.p1 TRINITY_DN15072_c0_g1~~TRINITY_DN15072_c0_g1_i1.p1  ORF type:complete len:322 (+),score=75.95 TRINITY_DN15072_c0_g1_i1:140-1105(+)